MKTKRHFLRLALTLASTIIPLSAQSPEYRLQRIDLVANSQGPLATPRPIYKGTLGSVSKPLVANADTLTALINGSSDSSISPDDNGQFYVSQGMSTLIDTMLRSIDSVTTKWIEIRFNDSDSGLAFDYWFTQALIKVPFTVWDLNSTLLNGSDDIQLMPLVYPASGDSSLDWGIRNITSPWSANPAKQSDLIYIHHLNLPFYYLWDDWTLQQDSSIINISLADEVLEAELLARITINSLNANPLTTPDSISGLLIPASGTIIRWTFGVTRMGLSADTLVFNKVMGGPNPGSQNISVGQPTYAVGDSLHWSAVASQPWITINPDRGATQWITDQITVNVNLNSLNLPGAMVGSITISSPEDTAQTVTVIGSVSDESPPSITHTPEVIADEGLPLLMTAGITDNWAIYSAKVYYRRAGDSAFQSTGMVESALDQYEATIPASFIVARGTQYYIEAIDSAALRSTYPISNPETNPVNIAVDQTPPTIVHTPVTTAPENTPLQISAEITDNWGLYSATVYYRRAGDSVFQSTGMVESEPDQYEATMPSNFIVARGTQYYIEAIDSALLKLTYPISNPETNPVHIAVDQTPPIINHTPVVSGDEGLPLLITAEITDNWGLVATTLYYRTSGDGVYQFAEMVESGADQYEASISGTIMAARGAEYYIEAVDSAHLTSTYPPSNPENNPVSIAVDNTPPMIVHTIVTTIPQNTPLQIDAVINDNWGVSSSQLFFRRGGEIGYQSAVMTKTEASLYQTEIPSNSIGINGVQYYLSATDSAGYTSTFPYTNPVDQPISVSVTGIATTITTERKTYRMYAVPYELSNLDPWDFMQDALGRYDKDNWRMFRRINRNYVELSSTSGWQLQPGEGFWLITKEEESIDLGFGTSTSTSDTIEISLYPGWTIIGTPFGFSVSWGDISRPPSVENQLMAWDGSAYYPTNILNPGEGYFVYNNSDNSVILHVPPIAALGKSISKRVTELGNNQKLSGCEWQIQISASSERSKDSYNYLGVREDADLFWDTYDLTDVPLLDGQLGLYFPNNAWNRYPGHYRADYHAPSDSGDIWQVEIISPPGEIEISLVQMDNFPDHWNLILLDQELGSTHDLLGEGIYSRNIRQDSPPIKLKFIAGISRFTDGHILELSQFPVKFNMAQNYPNPFNPSTTITFGLPKTIRVQIVIYDLRGREVKRLVDSEVKHGRHTTIWHGLDSKNNPVSNGIYIARLATPEYSKSIKMVLLK